MWQRVRGWFGRLPAFVRWNLGCTVLFIALCLGCLGVMAVWPEEEPAPTSEAPPATEPPATQPTHTVVAPQQLPTLAPTAELPTILPSRTPSPSPSPQATSSGAGSLTADDVTEDVSPLMQAAHGVTTSSFLH